MAKITVLSREIAVQTRNEEDYICITDIARYRDADCTDDLIRNWLRNRDTIEFLGIREQLNTRLLIPWNSTGLEKHWP